MNSLVFMGSRRPCADATPLQDNKAKNMNKQTIITALLTAVLTLTSCHQSAQKAEAGQQADTTETVTSADTLRLVVKDKELTASALAGTFSSSETLFRDLAGTFSPSATMIERLDGDF